MTTTLANLLRAVLIDPADDFRRLVLADWLDDNGDPARAEFIRLQCKLSTLGECERDFSLGLSCCCKFCRGGGFATERRERELLVNATGLWFAFLGRPAHVEYLSREDFDAHKEPTGKLMEVLFHRGFVSEVRCPLSSWLAHGPAIVACQPVEAVVLADREPVGPLGATISGVYRQTWSWERRAGDRHAENLPACLFDMLKSGALLRYGTVRAYNDPESARADLSRAAVLLARSLAGLPPLP